MIKFATTTLDLKDKILQSFCNICSFHQLELRYIYFLESPNKFDI